MAVVVPVLSLPVHLAYGWGTLCGLLVVPRFLWRTRGYTLPFPVSAVKDPTSP
jgi:hypothetical protein